MKRLGMAGLVWLMCAGWAAAEDSGASIIGTRADGTTTGTSNTAIIYGFWSARPPGGTLENRGWTTTRTQTLGDGTTTVLKRAMIREWLCVQNLTTSYVLYVTVNEPNETTPTMVGVTREDIILWPRSTGFQSRAYWSKLNEVSMFKVWNVGVYAYWADLTDPVELLTSATVWIRGR